MMQLERTYGGWVYLTLDAEQAETAILHANGNAEFIVNGAPRAGDVYAKGRVLLPANLRRATANGDSSEGRMGR